MIEIFTTGGTIDKVYFDANSEFEIGDSLIAELLAESNIHDGYTLNGLLRKDSLEITDGDREVIRTAVSQCDAERILITHGTDTMPETARELLSVKGKTIVLFGAMQPARMRRSDAVFNIGYAWAAVQLLPHGVYIAMNGEVFEAGSVRKNLKAQRFERT
ncbi:L-asparaginase [Marinobacter salarius]|jgi:L-asparaginase|uniref:Asparaginase n=1 Tax=Marinobacter salarius TaxID=1420917 RepID=W5YN76_9GAMM|nr:MULTISPECIES: asparaginase domain-containing protein [Marinobacter]AHI30571.1 asparaginase [Marinobacter salarius]ARM82669.1 putative L-asparaginase periplasmic [Marinobacter salarius]KXJ46343.1 MAG: asparaginase [Marinobacter sp. Hex_13]MBS8231077.1 asparaginase [Marinobacter salarius]SFL74147.1 L-asparaginase [Marinobacter salarius]|tara:strand:- start:1002 stop:1481 length:480 start_codon:yes stop_codon:yes gene_type:complete